MNLAAAPLSTPMPRPAAPRLTLSDALFTKFAGLVYELSGMRFEANKNYFLASKIDVRMNALGLKTPEDYLKYLESPAGRAEYGPFIDEVSINETFFYRHEPQLQAFISEVLQPLVFARKAARQLKFRIWSAAASTGDELYTLALMLHDLGLAGPNSGLAFELVGTDISHDALQKARAGVYRKYNIRNVPPALLNKFFKHEPTHTLGEVWTLAPEIKAMCKFTEGNLMDSTRCAALGKFDIIFVRNVLIYFDEPSKEQVVKNLVAGLHDDGFVIMGHSENVYGQRHLLRPDKTKLGSLAHIKAPPGTPKY